ncbi:MAG: peptidoglycan DD-metalloendopeptidase family protein [Clostridia bacterium]|nr:peptidoglycan DD-metalloendopeptidase family protein [Clostridia bacterium]
MNRCRLATSFAHSKRRNIMNRFSNIISGKNKKRGVIVAGLVALIILISLAVMVSMPDITVTYAKKAEEVVAQNANIDTLEKDIEQNDSKDNIAENEEENTNAEISKQEVEQKANTNKETNEKSSDKNEEIKEDSSKEVSNKTEEKSSSEKTTTEENNKTVKSTEKTKEESGDTKTVTNTQETKTENKESKIKLSMPIKENYALSVKYSSRHTGIDLASLNGTNIYAAAKGKVIVSEFQQELGNVIVIDHGNGVKTYYACCSKLLKNVGDSVTENDVIAQVGQSGNSTGPHLHFEVRINDKVQNPETFLPNL